MVKKCEQCNRVFEKKVADSRAYFAKKKFCGQVCFGLSRRGITRPAFSEEHKRKIGLANKNNKSGLENGKQTRFIKGMISPRKGKAFPQVAGDKNYGWKGGLPKCMDCNIQLGSYTAKRCVTCSGKVRVGENSPAWKHGLSKTKEYKAHYGRIKQDKRRGAVGKHSIVEWEDLKKKYNYMCLCCKQQEPFITLTRDHIVPLSRKGSNDISNIQPLCNSCNSRKYTKIISFMPATLWN